MTDKEILQNLMQKLDLTEKQAIELLASDREVDKMKTFKDIRADISTDQQQAIKKYTKVSRKVKTVNAYGKETQKVIKADDIKADIIHCLAEALKGNHNVSNLEIININKLIGFTVGSDVFEIDLKRKRKK